MDKIINDILSQENIMDKETGNSSNFLVIKDEEEKKALWLSIRVLLKIINEFLGKESFKIVLKDPKVANEERGIKAIEGRGVQFLRKDGHIIINTFLMAYGDQWRKEFNFEIEEDLFDSYLKVVKNNEVVREIIAKNKGPKSQTTFGE